MKYASTHSKGFTLVELLIVIALILVVSAAAIPLYGGLNSSSQLQENTTQIVQMIRTAQVRSVARLNDEQHGVYFDIDAGGDDRVILYQGSSYATRDSSYDRVISPASALAITTNLMGDEVTFSKGQGVPSNSGAITITHNVNGVKTIEINEFGKVEDSS